MTNVNDLSEIALDALKEIGNIGAGNAATSLSEMIQRKVDMNVPKVQIVDFHRLDEVLGSPEALVTGVFLPFSGDIDGTIMFVMDQQSAFSMKDFFQDITKESLDEGFSDMEISLFKEVGNILAGSYLKALGNMTGLMALADVPLFAYDMLGAILSVPLIEFGKTGDKAMFIDSEFIEDEKCVHAHFFIIPESGSYDHLLKALGLE